MKTLLDKRFQPTLRLFTQWSNIVKSGLVSPELCEQLCRQPSWDTECPLHKPFLAFAVCAQGWAVANPNTWQTGPSCQWPACCSSPWHRGHTWQEHRVLPPPASGLWPEPTCWPVYHSHLQNEWANPFYFPLGKFASSRSEAWCFWRYVSNLHF